MLDTRAYHYSSGPAVTIMDRTVGVGRSCKASKHVETRVMGGTHHAAAEKSDSGYGFDGY